MQDETISEDLTPPQDGPRHPFRIHSSTRAWRRPKVTVHEPVNVVTPVTSARKPQFTPRIYQVHAITPTDSKLVRRKLFSVLNAPKQKRRRSDLQPLTFRVDGGRERTQPADEGPERRLSYARGGFLTARLNRSVAEAMSEIRAFKSEMVLGKGHSRRLQAMLDKSLVLRVLGIVDDVVYAKPWTADPGDRCGCMQFAVMVSRHRVAFEVDMDGLRQNAEGFSVFVPQPWDLVDSQAKEGQWIVTASKINLFQMRSEEVDLLRGLTLNKAIEDKDNVLHGLGMEASNVHSCRKMEQGQDEPQDDGVIVSFSEVSPHLTVVTVMASIFAVLPEHNLAILRDQTGGYALLKCGSTSVEVSEKTQCFSKLYVSEKSFSLLSLIEIMSTHCKHRVLVQEKQEGIIPGYILVLSMPSLS